MASVMEHITQDPKIWPCVLGGVAVGAAGMLALAHVWTPSTCHPAPTGKIGLHYWNGRGLMEIARMCLAYAGKFPGDYDDNRYTTDPPKGCEKSFSDVANKLSANLGRLPVLTVGEETIGQSIAIHYYVAAECGLLGHSHLDAAKVLEISAHLDEMKRAHRTLIPYGAQVTEEKLEEWFTSGATDTSPASAVGKDAKQRFFKWYTQRIEYRVGSGGHAVGGKLTLADLLIYNTFAELLRDFESAPTVQQSTKEPWGSKARTDAALAGYPKIKAICDKVAAEPSMIKWFANRSNTPKGKNLQRF